MAAPTSRSALIGLATGGNSGNPEIIHAYRDVREAIGSTAFAVTAGHLWSHWAVVGSPAHGAAPGASARNPTNATNGSLMQTDAAGGRTKYLVDIGYGSASNATTQAILYDRLADISGLSGTVTTAQNTTGLAVTRYTGSEAAGNQIYLEVYTQIGASGTTITCSYTNQDGTAGRTTPAIGFGGGVFGRLVCTVFTVPLQAGDTGVRSVESVTLAASTGTAGDFGVTIGRPLAWMSTDATGSQGLAPESLNLPNTGPIPIKAGACLAFMSAINATSPGPQEWSLKFVDS